MDGKDIIPITVMYVGKDEDGIYSFIDSGVFKLSKKYIEEKNITIDREFDPDIALEIYARVRGDKAKKEKINRKIR